MGLRRLWRLHWAHRFDLVMLGVSVSAYLIVEMPGSKNALYVDSRPIVSDLLELPRSMMVFRCALCAVYRTQRVFFLCVPNALFLIYRTC